MLISPKPILRVLRLTVLAKIPVMLMEHRNADKLARKFLKLKNEEEEMI